MGPIPSTDFSYPSQLESDRRDPVPMIVLRFLSLVKEEEQILIPEFVLLPLLALFDSI